ncbi:MAG: phosphoadenosine phosphosulfate reductase family protein [Burkholderiaceae bacterium]|jgi:phosphoadenosine phosphosulfate reductase|nr:phosphoadenosine phosphosulfate reductase family protein [Burkholderiaceae bacterium]
MTDGAADLFGRHERVAFQLSGGRDSVAALHVLRRCLPRMTVYFTDSGDVWPETLVVLHMLEQRFGFRAVRIQSDAPGWRARHGDPTDVLPVCATPLGQMVSGCPTRLCTRYECCWNNLMLPMHQRMLADGITCIVRGVRHGDYQTHPVRSGQEDGGIQAYYPIWDWDEPQVDAYLEEHALPRAPWYEQGARHGSDCLTCTAWWDDGRQAYMRRHHPQAWQALRVRLSAIRQALAGDLALLEEQLASRG